MTTTRVAAKQRALQARLQKQRLADERRAQATALVMMELAKRGIYAPVRTPRAPQMKRRSKLRFPPIVTHQGYGAPTPGRGKGLMIYPQLIYPQFYSAME